MAANYRWNEFADRGTLAPALAGRIAEALAGAIARRGRALMAVVGRTTPKMLSRRCRGTGSPGTSDRDAGGRRFVPPPPRSNAALVAENLLQNEAAAARLRAALPGRPDAGGCGAGRQRRHEAAALAAGRCLARHGHRRPHRLLLPRCRQSRGPARAGSDRIVLPVHAPSAGEPRLTLRRSAHPRGGVPGPAHRGRRQARRIRGGDGQKRERARKADRHRHRNHRSRSRFWAP